METERHIVIKKEREQKARTVGSAEENIVRLYGEGNLRESLGHW